MFEEIIPKKNTSEFPKDLENMSVADLEGYIDELTDEISRVNDDILNKKKSHDAANSIFK